MSDGERTNPYVGLRPFFDDDSLYFYGREQQTAELLSVLRDHRFLAIVGSSGSGKSSLVRAGLLPGLIGGFLVQDRDRWRNVQVKPGDAPIANLAAGLAKAMGRPGDEAATLEQKIRDDHAEAIVRFLCAHLDDRTNVFILVDQFEEIFAFRGANDDIAADATSLERRQERARRREEAADFVDLLLRLAERRDVPIYLALTMRTDFLGECDLFYGLPEAFNRGRYLVPRLTREQLRDAVECPALLLGAEVAPRLLDYVLNELGDRADRLPVLQHALLRTWEAWDRGGRSGPIDLVHYRVAGGLEGALDQDAENALKDLDRDATARVLKRLTTTDASQRQVRSPARISELVAASGAAKATVEGIVTHLEAGGRSFVHPSADGHPADPRVDISHESLIRQWASLRTWVEEERASSEVYKDLLARSRKRKAGAAALLRDPELKIVFDWRQKERPSPEWARRYSHADDDFTTAIEYLDDSVKARSREVAEIELSRQWRRRWAPVLVLLTVGLFAWVARAEPGAFSALTRRPALPVPAETVTYGPMIWTTRDSQRTLTLEDAQKYCYGLRTPLHDGGEAYSGWRLPMQAELLSISSGFDESLGRKLKEEFHLGVTSDYLWSGSNAGDSPADGRWLAADFKREILVPLSPEVADTASAICVSSFDGNAPVQQDQAKRVAAEDRTREWRQIALVLVYLGFMLTLYYLLALACRWLQRKLTFASFVRRFAAAGGRDPAEAVASAVSRVDAATTHNTFYALPYRRLAGGAIDLVPLVLVFVGGLVAISSDDPRVTVTRPDGTFVDGALVDWVDDIVEVRTDTGARVKLSTLQPPEPEVVTLAGGTPVQTTLPSGASVQGTSFLQRLVRVPIDTGEEWYGTLGETRGNRVFLLKYKLEDWRKTRDAFLEDLRWRFGSNPEVGDKIGKWTKENPQPAPNVTAERTFLLRGNEVGDIVYPPSDVAVGVWLVAIMIFAWLYDALQIASKRRATIGMRLAGIVVTDLHGQQLSFGQATRWHLYRLGSYLTFGLGLIVQPFTRKWQTLHDRLSGSVVLRRARSGVTVVAPTTRQILLARTFVVGTPVLLVPFVMGLMSNGNLAMVGSPEAGNAWRHEQWDKLGVVLMIDEFSLNGTVIGPRDWSFDQATAPPSVVVDRGTPIVGALKSIAELVPPPRCPDGGCPIGYAYGYESISDGTESVVGKSECGKPVFLATAKRQEPFALDMKFTLDAPGRYVLWLDFTKMPECRGRPGGLTPEPTLTERHIAIIEVK